MTTTPSGRVGSAETGSREPSPSCTGLGPAGFDPAREGHLLLSRVQCALMDREMARGLVRLHAGNFETAQRAIAEFNRATETLAAVFERMGGVEALEALQAIAMEARRVETTQIGSIEDDSAAIAQPLPSSDKERE